MESSHALAHALKMIHQEPNKEQILVVNLSGRGDKDIFTVDKVLKEKGMQIMSRFETKFAELAAKKKGLLYLS